MALPASNKYWRISVATGLVLLALSALYESYQVAWRHTVKKLQEDARNTARLRVLVLQSELEKQRAIPLIFADDSDVIAAVQQPDVNVLQQISMKLEKLKEGTHSAVIYILDANGVTLAASNWASPISFVGKDYSFREYFQQAIANGYAEQFALGTVSRKPGLYLAQRIWVDKKAIGVVVVKVEFDEMEAAWAKATDETYVINGHNDILLTFDPALRFQPARLPDNTFLTTLAAPVPGWELQVASSLQPARKAGQNALVMAAMAEILVAMTAFFLVRRQQRSTRRALVERRYRQQLEDEVTTRTGELRQTNERLSQEITERQQAEQKLNLLQLDLLQANKLTALGQITAGVAHEINQPLATVRVLADNTLKLLKKNGSAPVLVIDNLDNIVRMSERIGHITGELRAFSRKATGKTEAVALKDTVESSILLNNSRLRENTVKLTCDAIDPGLQVMAGRIRLEQVMVNLLQNAFEALEGTANPKVHIAVVADGQHITFSIIDNGPGIAADVYNKLFTPFTTTKLHGLGLGLVIVHDIVRDFGGELRVDSSAEGTSFHIKLRKVNHG